MDETGERYLPSMGLQMSLEHWHRYLLVAELADGADVLDIACGQGYGSHHIASRAASVVGVDISAEAVAEARTAYAAPNLRYEVGSVDAIPLPDQSVDLIVSFETIEHVSKEQQLAFYAEVRRVLRPAGKLVISTPDKTVYSTDRHYENPFHFNEYERAEFLQVLSASFPCVKLCEQRAGLFSLVVNGESPKSLAVKKKAEGTYVPGSRTLTYEYLIAVCSPADVANDGLPTSVAFDQAILSEQYDTGTQALLSAMAVAEERADEIRALTEAREAERRSRSSELAGALSMIEERGQEIARLCEEVVSLRALSEERGVALETHSRDLLSAQAVAAQRADLLRDQAEELTRLQEKVKRLEGIVERTRPLDLAELGEEVRTPVSDQPLVSVVVPSYNHGRFIGLAIDSALNQTYANVEVIVIDDGSSDGSEQLLAARYGADRRVRVLARENRGAHATLNEAIALARGEFISILNSDDVYDPARFEKLIEAARSHGGHPFFGISALRVVDEQGEPAPESGPLRYYSSVLEKFAGEPDAASFWVGNLAMTTSNFFFSRAVFERVGGFSPLRYTHDWDWALRASERFKVVRLSDVLLHYRAHGSNTISEGNLYKHVAENAFVFGSALRRVGLVGMAELAGVRPQDVLKALLSNDSFVPVPTLCLMALGQDPASLTRDLASGALEKLLREVLSVEQVGAHVLLSLEQLSRGSRTPAPKSKVRPALPTDKDLTMEQRVRALRKLGARMRKRVLRTPSKN